MLVTMINAWAWEFRAFEVPLNSDKSLRLRHPVEILLKDRVFQFHIRASSWHAGRQQAESLSLCSATVSVSCLLYLVIRSYALFLYGDAFLSWLVIPLPHRNTQSQNIAMQFWFRVSSSVLLMRSHKNCKCTFRVMQQRWPVAAATCRNRS